MGSRLIGPPQQPESFVTSIRRIQDHRQSMRYRMGGAMAQTAAVLTMARPKQGMADQHRHCSMCRAARL